MPIPNTGIGISIGYQYQYQVLVSIPSTKTGVGIDTNTQYWYWYQYWVLVYLYRFWYRDTILVSVLIPIPNTGIGMVGCIPCKKHVSIFYVSASLHRYHCPSSSLYLFYILCVFLWCLFLFCESSAKHLSLIDASDQLRNSHCALAGASLWTCGCWVTRWLSASVGLWFELGIWQFYGIMSFCHKNGWKQAGFGGHLIVNLEVYCYSSQTAVENRCIL